MDRFNKEILQRPTIIRVLFLLWNLKSAITVRKNNNLSKSMSDDLLWYSKVSIYQV